MSWEIYENMLWIDKCCGTILKRYKVRRVREYQVDRRRNNFVKYLILELDVGIRLYRRLGNRLGNIANIKRRLEEIIFWNCWIVIILNNNWIFMMDGNYEIL